MTLLVAANDEKEIWMVADTAITGGTIAVREQEYEIKIVPSKDKRALIGFAGDHHFGSKAIHQAAIVSSGKEGIAILEGVSGDHTSAEFAYGYFDGNKTQLLRIKNGKSEPVPTLHLGSDEAFEHFQKIRLRADIDFVPGALVIFFCGNWLSGVIPQNVKNAIRAMFALFAERQERDLGGWPTAFMLTKEGAALVGYGYSVSDPILPQITPGSVVPHGTPSGGGFTLSITESGRDGSMVVYWLQRPGGSVYVRTNTGYDAHHFDGNPTKFTADAKAALKREIHVMCNETDLGVPDRTSVHLDANGKPGVAIATKGRSFSVFALNVTTPFHSIGPLETDKKSKQE
jgi:hypothetical protein